MNPITEAQRNRIYGLKDNHEEYVKCQNDPLYFHNKYVKDPREPDLTYIEFERLKLSVKNEREKLYPRKPISPYKNA